MYTSGPLPQSLQFLIAIFKAELFLESFVIIGRNFIILRNVFLIMFKFFKPCVELIVNLSDYQAKIFDGIFKFRQNKAVPIRQYSLIEKDILFQGDLS